MHKCKEYEDILKRQKRKHKKKKHSKKYYSTRKKINGKIDYRNSPKKKRKKIPDKYLNFKS